MTVNLLLEVDEGHMYETSSENDFIRKQSMLNELELIWVNDENADSK